MDRKVLCVGSIWDLDEVVYPELDEYSEMTFMNQRQLVKFQLSSSKKEISNVVKLPLFPRNKYGIRVRACCASCQLKEITLGGIRKCTLSWREVNALNKCKHWQMAEMLQEVGK